MPRPLHDTPIESSAWWACSQPERPVDGWCVYDVQCPKCTIKANADLAHDPDLRAVNVYDESDVHRLRDHFRGVSIPTVPTATPEPRTANLPP